MTIENKAKLNKKLLHAASSGDTDTIADCLKQGADVNTQDKNGRTPLHAAAEGNHLKAAKLLIQSKAKINSEMNDMGTPLLDAVAWGHDGMVSLLLKHGADCTLADEHGLNALHWAAQENRPSTAELLIQYSPTLVTCKNAASMTPLHLATSVEMARLLITKGALVNALDNQGDSSLSKIVFNNGNLELIKLLVRRGTNLFSQNKAGESVIDVAQKYAAPETIAYLKEKAYLRLEKTQLKFFDYRRSHKKQTKTLRNAYQDFRENTHGDNKEYPICADNIPARRLVMADSGAVAASLQDVDLATLTSRQTIAERSSWHNAGYAASKKVNMSWNYEYVDYNLGVDPDAKKKVPNRITISSQYKPEPGHLGNFFMRGIGSYGRGENNILEIIDDLTCVNPPNEAKQALNERRLARLMLSYLKNGTAITTLKLRDAKIATFSTKSDRIKYLEKLIRICYLTGVKEVTRRLTPGVRADNTVVPQFPMGAAYLMSLQLIEQGHLSMRDVFDANAPYGLPTAQSLSTAREIGVVKEKLIRLASLFYANNPEKEQTREGIHQLLRGYGGESDTSGDEYLTSDESDTDEDYGLRGGRNGGQNLQTRV